VDSGFGLLTTQDLAENGFKVYAGCLTAEGVARLEGKVDKERKGQSWPIK